MSVWEGLEQLRAYVFDSDHRELLLKRREWFEKFEGVYAALWWVAAGHIPTVEEAKQRLAHLAEKGETPYAFTFKNPFAPGSNAAEAAARERPLTPGA
jgi:hypothetical protein